MAVTATLSDPNTIRRTAAEVIQRPDYRLDMESKADELLLSLVLRALELLNRAFQWLFHLLEGLPPWLQWVIVIAMVLTAILICAHFVYTI
ncbi:MAG: hypothetical protein JWN70_423, partial [Planctomycetaceae bacterium]|nr:hypothetical protein [Planctomycetaceae bacterium]